MSDSTQLFADSAAYERFMGRWSRLLAPRLVQLTEVKAGDAVLDVGCGTGVMSFALLEAEPAAQVTGIDRSEQYLAFARSQATERRCTFRVADAQRLQFGDAAFHRSVSLLVLNFVPRPAAAVREMIRVTKPGGAVTAAVWAAGEGFEMLQIFWEEVLALDPSMATRDERNMPLRNEGELAALWRSQGLDRVEESALDIEQQFTSFDDYWAPFLGGQGPAGAYAASLSPAALAALEQRLRARLLGDGKDRPFTLKARAWAARGFVSEG